MKDMRKGGGEQQGEREEVKGSMWRRIDNAVDL